MTRNIQPVSTSNSLSTQVVEVATSTGFNAGDYVYYNGATNSYTGASSLVPTSAVFSSTNLPIGGSGAFNTPMLNANPAGTTAGAGLKNCAALLTNGNIVQVFIKKLSSGSSTPYFTITDNTQTTTVVAATQISATFTNNSYPSISVVALTGGGFAVAWMNTAGGTVNYPCYAVYTNTGTVTTAAAQDTAAGVAGSATYGVQIVPLSSGGFAIAYASSAATVIYHRAYGATGVATYAWGNITGWVNLLAYGFGFTATSNNNLVFFGSSANSTLRYAMTTAGANTLVVAATTFLTASGNSNATVRSVDAAVLSDGTSVVFCYTLIDQTSQGNQPFFRICTTTSTSITVPTTDIYVPYQNIGYASTGNYAGLNDACNLTVLPFSGSNFIIAATTYNANNCQYQMGYASFSSSGVCTSGLGPNTNALGVSNGWHIIGNQILNSSFNKYGIVEITSLSTAYIYVQSERQWTTLPAAQYYFKFNTTTYQLSYNASSTQASGATATLTPSSMALNTMTPTSAYYYGPGGYSRGAAGNVVIKSATTIEASTTGSYGCVCGTLPTGNIVVAHYTTSNYIAIKVYTPLGVLTQSTVTSFIGSIATGQFNHGIKMAVMTSGKLGLIYYSGSGTTYNVVVLAASTYTQIGTTQTLTDVRSNVWLCTAAISNDRFVVGWGSAADATQGACSVFGNTGAAPVYSSGNIDFTAGNGYETNNYGISGTSDGSFMFSGGNFNSGPNPWGFYPFINTTGNTFTTTGFVQINAPNSDASRPYLTSATPDGMGMVPFVDTGSGWLIYCIRKDGSYNQVTSAAITGYSVPGTYTQSYCTTGNGTFAAAFSYNGQIYVWGYLPYTGTQTLITPYTTGLLPKTNTTQLSSTSAAGNSIFICYCAVTTNYPTFGIVTIAPQSTNGGSPTLSSEWLNTSTSASPSTTAASIVPTSTAVSTNVGNAVLAGVAVSAAAAGGSGQIAINGPAQLNSNYSATNTAYFDFTGQAVPGVRGAVNGRTVNLQGNS
jgi:hypothetical protein